MFRRLLWLFLAVPFLGACEEDSDPPVDPGFSVDLTVVDSNGDAMAGVEAYLHIPLPPGITQDKSSGRAATAFRFEIPAPRRVSLDVYDLQGEPVRQLLDAELPAGAHELVWDARDQTGQPFLGTRVFEVLMRVFDGDKLLYGSSVYPVLHTGLDAGQQPLVGTTDASGRLRIEDRDLFPMLDAPTDLEAMDETGASQGSFAIGDEAQVRLRDPNTQESMVVTMDIQEGPNRRTVAWTPAPAPPARIPAVLPAKDVPVVPVPPNGLELRTNFPNPFN